MAAGNGLALIRPPETQRDDDDLPRAPVVRSLVYVAVGLLAAIWGLASLFGAG